MAETFRTQVYVRWSDQDIYGHVNNARVVTLLEEARIMWRQHVVDVDGCAGFDTTTLVASLQLDYRRPVEFGLDVDIDIRVERIGSKSYTLRYRGYQAGIAVLDGSTVLVPLDPDTGKARQLSAEEQEYLARLHKEPLSA